MKVGEGVGRAPTRDLSSLKGGSVTLLNYRFPSAEPNSEVVDVALYSRGEWSLEQPLEGGIDSGCVLLIELRCLTDCLVILTLPSSSIVSPMPILVPHFPQVEPLLQPDCDHFGHPSLSCLLSSLVGRITPSCTSVVSVLCLLPLTNKSPLEDLMPTDLRLCLRYSLNQRMN